MLEDRMPVLFRRLPTGTILVDVASAVTGGARVARWCARRNGKRVGLRRILSDPSATVIVVERRDRLARFGVEYLEAALAAQSQRIAVADPDETAHDLVRDMIEVVTSVCARLYGRRGAWNRAMRVVTAAEKDPVAT